MLDGRVKTLHPKIHGGILAVRGNREHMRQLSEKGMGRIDLVIVNLYPFEQTISNKDVKHEDAIENIDIGGLTLIRAAAKNYESVGVVVDPSDYAAIMEKLRRSKSLSDETRKKLALKAFQHTARYDSIISDYLEKKFGGDLFPHFLNLTFEKQMELRYGENPHQRGRSTGVWTVMKPPSPEPESCRERICHTTTCLMPTRRLISSRSLTSLRR